jgi:hypothetical protein
MGASDGMFSSKKDVKRQEGRRYKESKSQKARCGEPHLRAPAGITVLTPLLALSPRLPFFVLMFLRHLTSSTLSHLASQPIRASTKMPLAAASPERSAELRERFSEIWKQVQQAATYTAEEDKVR